MIEIRSAEELKLMRKSGYISARALKRAINQAKVGISLLEIDRVATEEIKSLGGELSFITEPGYKWATCLTVNDEVVHGIPRDIILKEGDLLSIDVGALYKGWHTDTAWSIVVGGKPTKFLQVGKEALWKGIKQAQAGKRIGDISESIQKTVESAGYSISRSLVGHGVGKKLHEDPEVPGFGKKGTGPYLKKGMTLAIEVIYTEGKADLQLAEDGWTISSKDGSLGGLFEMTVIIADSKPEVITDWREV